MRATEREEVGRGPRRHWRDWERDDWERGPRRLRGRECCGPWRCGGPYGRGPRWDVEEATPSRRWLEERQRDLEEELADITEQLRDRRGDRS